MDPTAPSLLWAHELRRENVQLVNQMDRLNNILSSATSAITTLHKSVDILTDRIQELEEQRDIQKRDFDDKIQQLRNDRSESNEKVLKFEEALERVSELGVENVTLKGGLREVSEKCGALETENGELKERICVLEKEASVQRKQVARIVKWISMKTVGEDKEKRETGSGTRPGTRPKRIATDQDQDSCIPDSMPTPRSHHSTRVSSRRTLSETTWGSLTDLDGPCIGSKAVGNSPLRNEGARTGDQKILESIRQECQTLGEYLASTVALRARYPLIPEEAFVMAFIGGLDDDDLRKRTVDLTRHAGLSWKSVMSFVQSVIRNPVVEKQADAQLTGSLGGEDAAGVSAGKRKENRNRRTIPIVPADDDDELFVT